MNPTGRQSSAPADAAASALEAAHANGITPDVIVALRESGALPPIRRFALYRLLPASAAAAFGGLFALLIGNLFGWPQSQWQSSGRRMSARANINPAGFVVSIGWGNSPSLFWEQEGYGPSISLYTPAFIVRYRYRDFNQNVITERWLAFGPAWWLLVYLPFARDLDRGARFLIDRAAVRQLLRQWRARHLCPRCGYDVRATPVFCPECGYVLPRQKWPEIVED